MPFRPRLGRNELYACWHEHLLPLAWLFAGQGGVTLASRDRDGEVVARVLAGLGYRAARGSSGRGGDRGFRELARALAGGGGVILTGDGPRGPRRSLKAGAARLAARAGSRASVIGVASSAGWRLPSWDRFLIPAPGATVFVSLANAGSPQPRSGRAAATSLHDQLQSALARETGRCEQLARQQRRSGAAAASRAIERRIRAQWRRARPSAPLRSMARAYGLAHDGRHRLYDYGALPAHKAGLPVISVGGATAGGSGKTPLAAHIAQLLADEGHMPAIITPGYADELDMLARQVPQALVLGHANRLRLARRAARAGRTVVVLDDGFQHRRLHRDLDLLLLDRDALRRTNGARLPAGPFRERWAWAAGRADAIIFTGREPWSEEVASFDGELRKHLGRLGVSVPVATLHFEAGSPEPGNGPARAWHGPPAPGLAVTGIMKPNLFYSRARQLCPSLRSVLALPDHGAPTAAECAELTERAGRGGALVTHKDLSRLEPLIEANSKQSPAGEPLPVWVLPERIRWREGRAQVRELILAAAAPAPLGSVRGRDGMGKTLAPPARGHARGNT